MIRGTPDLPFHCQASQLWGAIPSDLRHYALKLSHCAPIKCMPGAIRTKVVLVSAFRAVPCTTLCTPRLEKARLMRLQRKDGRSKIQKLRQSCAWPRRTQRGLLIEKLPEHPTGNPGPCASAQCGRDPPKADRHGASVRAAAGWTQAAALSALHKAKPARR